MDASKVFEGIRLVPVVKLSDAETAVPLARTLYDSGIRAIEITLRTGAALDAIGRVARDVPEMLVGAGSVRRAEQVGLCVDSGAQFLVSPGSTASLLAAVEDANVPCVPGAVTATEMMRLQEAGYRLQKFFSAELSGGVAMLKALAQPLPEVRFFPTGGISADNVSRYLDLPQVACVGGSWFVKEESLTAKDFEGIGVLAAEAVTLTRG